MGCGCGWEGKPGRKKREKREVKGTESSNLEKSKEMLQENIARDSSISQIEWRAPQVEEKETKQK